MSKIGGFFKKQPPKREPIDPLKIGERLCADCDKLMRQLPFIELDTYRLMTELKLKQGLIYDTILTHRKFHKLSQFIKDGRVERLYQQDVLERNLGYKRLILSNGPLQTDSQYRQLLTGQLLMDLQTALNLLEKHVETHCKDVFEE